MNLAWGYLRKHRGALAAALALAAVNQFFSLLDPQIFRIIVDTYARRAGELDGETFISGILLLLAAAVFVAFVSRVAKNFQDYAVNVVTQRVGTELYSDAVDHALSLPYAAFEDHRSGEILRKLEKAKIDTQAAIGSSVNVIFLSTVGILLVVAYAFTVHWIVGVTYLAMIPILGGITFGLSRKIKASQQAVVRESASLAGSTTETLRNIELVKSLGLERQEISRLNEQNEKILGFELQKVKLVRYLSFAQGTLVNVTRSALLFIMLWLIFLGAITLGEFFTLFIYSFFIFSPLYELGNVAAQFEEARASLGELHGILKIPREATPEKPIPIGSLREIVFDRAEFSYPGIESPALHGINLKISAGETVAFVGPSGSGKSTVMKIFLGLYRPTSGELTLNGIPSGRVDYREFRKRIGFVSQETQLFAGTIRQNLLFVRPEATDAECFEVIRQAAAMPILGRGISRSGEEGLDVRIGEGGVKLSGGERQRIAIARALLRNPELLIFDEATSSLDSITEREITNTIERIEEKRPELTTVLVAHRLSTVKYADRIYVLERGALVEEGSHAALLARGGLYAALWREQMGSNTDPGFERRTT